MPGWFKPPKTFRVRYKDSGITHVLKGVVAYTREWRHDDVLVFYFGSGQEDRRYPLRNVDVQEITDDKTPSV
jgi:hypothetical protein